MKAVKHKVHLLMCSSTTVALSVCFEEPLHLGTWVCFQCHADDVPTAPDTSIIIWSNNVELEKRKGVVGWKCSCFQPYLSLRVNIVNMLWVLTTCFGLGSCTGCLYLTKTASIKDRTCMLHSINVCNLHSLYKYVRYMYRYLRIQLHLNMGQQVSMPVQVQFRTSKLTVVSYDPTYSFRIL